MVINFVRINELAHLQTMANIGNACDPHKRFDKQLFINTSDSFAIPICGERVTWGCLNG